jgi:hypothetical protein
MHVEIPTLESLLANYAAQTASAPQEGPPAPSPTTPDELARIVADLAVALPADYQALALRYDLAFVEVNFSRFYPPVARSMRLFDALATVLSSSEYPFSEEYRRWGVVPVGEDTWQNELALAVRQPTEPRTGQPRQPTHPLAPTRPYGTVWAYYPDEMHPSMRYAFAFVGSSFTQVLHMALFCWHVSGYRRQSQAARVREEDVRDALAAIDQAPRVAPYWRLWIAAAVEET